MPIQEIVISSWKEFLKYALKHLFTTGLAFLLFFFWVFFLHKYAWIPMVIVLIAISFYQAAKEIAVGLRKQYKKTLMELQLAQNDAALWKQSLVEKSSGFPSLLKAIDDYEKLRDANMEELLKYKKHPALKAAEVVREEAQRRRQADYDRRKIGAIIEYYESIAPFLVDFKEDIAEVEDEERYRDYDEEERQDPATYYLTKEEYRKLSSIERNQRALNRFWERPKSNWLLGRIYERFIGYLYEKQGYDVEYVGIFKGYEDLGRDLICKKAGDILVIQCKNWSQFKTIYEKHIFQFFGTVFQYKDANPKANVKGIFYTTTQLSELARRFAHELNIGLKENFKFDRTYPCIKCNVSRIDETKIYHLPFDQQYDNVKIEKERREFYCTTVKEAEEKGFRRAYRYRGNKE
jgi:hypothetical protein